MKLKQKFALFSEDSLFKNAAYLVANSGLGSVAGFAFWLIAARLYSTEDIGLATTIISVVGFIGLLSDLGFTVSLIKYLPESKNKNDLINTCFTISGIFSIVASIIFVEGVNVYSTELAFLKLSFIYSIIFIFYGFLVISVALQDSVFIAFRNTKFSFLKMNIQAILKIPLLFICISLDSFGILLSFFIAYLLATLISIYIFIPKINPSYKPLIKIDYLIVKNILHFSTFNYIARIFESIPSAALPLLITTVLNPEKTAHFYMAWMIATIVYVIPQSISKSLFAEGSNTYKDFSSKIKKSIRVSFYFLIPITIIFFLFGGIILSMFGKEYSSGGLHLLWFLLLSGIPLIFNNVCITVNNIEDNTKHIIYINVTITALTLVITYFTLETLGIISVGIAWFLSQIIVAIPSIHYLYRYCHNNFQ